MSSDENVILRTSCITKQHYGHVVPSETADTCVSKVSELANASRIASLVSLERRSISCRVIRAGILATKMRFEVPRSILLQGFIKPYVFSIILLYERCRNLGRNWDRCSSSWCSGLLCSISVWSIVLNMTSQTEYLLAERCWVALSRQASLPLQNRLKKL